MISIFYCRDVLSYGEAISAMELIVHSFQSDIISNYREDIAKIYFETFLCFKNLPRNICRFLNNELKSLTFSNIRCANDIIK